MTDEIDSVDPGRPVTASQAAGLTLAAARRIIAALSAAVIDAGDQLVAFERMDAADLVSISLARDKAYSALMNRMPTGELAAYAQPGAEFFGYESLSGGRMIVFAGGLPLERNGVLVGALGVSGGSADQDARAADAGARAFAQG